MLKPPTRDRVRATETLGSICMRTYQPGNGRLEEEEEAAAAARREVLAG